MARKSRKNLPQPEQAAASVLLPELEEAKYQQQSMGGFLLRMKKKKKAWKRRSRWCRIISIAAVN